MADYKDVAVDKFDISGREFYQETITPNSEHPRLARIYYNSDGTIDEKNTYLEWYIKEVLHPEQPTKKSVKKTKKDDKDEARPNKQKKKDDEDADPAGAVEKVFCIIGRILLWPFKAIWWIIKQILKLAWAIVKFVLSIIGLGFIVGLLSGGDSDA